MRTYGHFWGSGPELLEPKAWSLFYLDAQSLLREKAHYVVPGSLQGAVSGPDKRLIFDLSRLGEYGHFEIVPKPQAFTFCRTDRHASDALITALLLVAKHHMGAWLTLTSDGLWDDWEKGRELCRVVLNYKDENFLSAKSDFDSLIERSMEPSKNKPESE